MCGVIIAVLLSLATSTMLAAAQAPSTIQKPGTGQDPEQTATGRTSYLGREVAQTMHWQGAPWLMRRTREDEENGTLLRKWLAVQPGQSACDFGCGNGYHTLPLATAVGTSGQVLAVDLQPQMLTMLRKRCEQQQLNNVTYITATIDDPNLDAASCDLILLVDVYHELSHPVRVMARLRRALKSGGRIVLVEFRKEDKNVPIKPEHTMSKAQVVREMATHGLKLQAQFDGLPWQHAMAFVASDIVGKRFAARQLLDAFLAEVQNQQPSQVRPFLAAGLSVQDLPPIPADARGELRSGSGQRLIAELQRQNGTALPHGRDQIVLQEDALGRWAVQSIRKRQTQSFAHGSSRPFVPLHNALGGGTIAERIARAPQYGFDGVAWSFEQLQNARAACEANDCDLWSAYSVLDLSDGFEQRLPVIYDAITALAGGPGMLWLGLQNGRHKPRNTAGDDEAVRVLRTLLVKADAAGVEIALYPHYGFWLETASDAKRLCERIKHPRLGICFNLCHFLRNHVETDPTKALRACVPYLLAVTINGAKATGSDWSELIQPLGNGDVELNTFLQTLDDVGFRGPVGLQAYGIRQPPAKHLPVSMQAWQAAIGR
ncbi:MAG: sugar phosphate isomerase/epimerase/SAM-dependent methyltransferase [Planctomycetota bacterium]